MPVDLNDLGTFGRYVLLRRISLGGMAEVYKAKSYGDHGFEKVVALKRILPSVAESDRFVEMFIQEASIAAHLDHPNICRIYELGREGDSYYLTMEFLYGHDVRQLERRAKQLGQTIPPSLAAHIAAEVARALDHAWRATDETGAPLRLIHRDVSPQNVMVGYDGTVKLIDFGIAKVANAAVQTAAGVLKGKYAYMSPEQAASRTLDARADIWALGVLLHEMVTGRRLFVGASVADTIEQIAAAPIPPLDEAPPQLAAICGRMLERSLEGRTASHADVLGELQAFLAEVEVRPTAETLAAFMDTLFPESARLESDLSASDVRLVLSAEERGEETTDVRTGVSSATQIFLADSTGQAEYRLVLEALLARGRLQPATEPATDAARAPSTWDADAAVAHPPPVQPRAAIPTPWPLAVLYAVGAFAFTLLGLLAS